MTDGPDDDRPLWKVVYDDVLGRMTRGELCPGDLVPSEPGLAARHGVNRGTARAALQRLTDEGKITTVPGKRGRFVRGYEVYPWVLTELEQYPRLDNPEEGYDDWAARVARDGRTPRQELSVWTGKANGRIAGMLRIEEGSRVVARHRLRLINELPWQLSTSWFPWWLTEIDGGQLLLRPEDVVVPGGILAHIGHPMSDELDDEITPRLPTEEEIETLRLPPRGTAVAEHVRIGWSVDGSTPLRVMFTIAPGDRNKLVYRLRRGSR